MPNTVKTIQAVSAPRARPPAPPRAPLTAEEKKEKHAERVATQEKMDKDVEWFSYTHAKATELGIKYDKKARYFLDIFFQGGVHMVNHQEKTNPYNAFKAEKAAQRRDEGETGLKAQGLHEQYKEEYEALTEADKAALVERYDQLKDDIPKIRRDTPKARIRDVSNTVRNIQMLFHGLSYRVGIEGFFCIVRNTTDFYMGPQWYFTSDALQQYMPLAVRRKWDTGDVGTRLEAFALADCDTMNLLRSTQQKVAFLKGDIWDRVLAGLMSITGKSDIRMDYIYHEESIVLKYGVELVGWTCERFVNPSELSSSVTVLTTLCDALRDGECKWVKLTPAERRSWKEKWDDDVAAGKVIARVRAARFDIGRKRKVAALDAEEDEAPVTGGLEDDDEPNNNNEPDGSDEPTANGPIIDEPDDTLCHSAASKTPEDCTGAPKVKAATAALKAKAARTRGTAKENIGLGGRDDDVTRAALDQLKRRHLTKSRAIISDSDDDSEAVRTNNDAAGTPVSAVDPQVQFIDPSLTNLAA
ncbi:hypothetical protein GGX14DRAFT_580167 [Mycena pura]|uniref:Uncharacterized protein n=1 Tax=Mycena pura TaxID=153505 RepID=A0AAD6XXW9_9AGAR|nr:hypothetical protein GGX14DRAFT_580167 [Mycena pura]